MRWGKKRWAMIASGTLLLLGIYALAWLGLSRLASNVFGTVAVLVWMIHIRQFLQLKQNLQQEAGKSREHLEQAQALANMGSFELDPETQVVKLSDSLKKIMSAEPTKIYRLSDTFQYLSSTDEVKVKNYFEKIAQGRQPALEVSMMYPDGARIFRFKAELSPGNGKNRPTIMGVLSDITDQKKIEDELARAKTDLEKTNQQLLLALAQAREAADKAEKASEAKSEFVANMSHELRTPLTGVLGMADILLDSPLTEEQKGQAQIIKKSGHNLLLIINDLLDISKMEAGKLDIESTEFDLQQVVEEVAEILTPKAGEKELEFTYLIEADVPRRLRGDPGRLRQVIHNLAGNAIKFTETGEVVLRISRAAESAQEVELVFLVQDTGIGLAADKLGVIFEAFVQADLSSTRRFGGAGLGLTIAKRLVEKMKGTIRVESQLNSGSKFWFTLPLEKQAQVPGHPRRPDFTFRVLVADKNSHVRSWLSILLQGTPYPFAVAGSGQEVMAMLQQAAADKNPFNLLVVDKELPDMPGEEMLSRLGRDPLLAATRVILLLPVNQRCQLLKTMHARMAGCLNKPVRQSQLESALERVRLMPGNPPPETSSSQAGTSPSEDAGRPRKNILLVEDEGNSQLVIRKMLEKNGFKVEVASHGKQALEKLSAWRADAVLMDCYMPIMDGLEAARQIRGGQDLVLNPAVIIIALTASDLERDREACQAVGMNDFLLKPFPEAALLAKLNHWLNRPTAAPTAVARLKAKLGSLAVFDQNGLLQRMNGNGQLAQILIAGFVKNVPLELAAMQGELLQGETRWIGQHGNAIISAACNVGALAMEHAARCVQEAASQSDLQTLADLFPVLNEQFELAQVKIAAANI